MYTVNGKLSFIVESAQSNPEKLIFEAEKRYRDIVFEVSQNINQDSAKKIVMLAGPSGSGKTTTAGKIRENLEKLGHKAYTVSLDDFYKNIGTGPKNADGTYDFESIYSLDLDLIHKCLQELIVKNESELPLFDFMTGKRKEETNKIKLDDEDVIIVEGLHALNPEIVETLPEENLYKIYISVRSRIYENEDVVLSKRDLRFIRRMTRDFKFRNSPVEHTYDLWPKVAEGEDKYLFPFEDNADYKINSVHIYEPCVFKKEATELLSAVKPDSPNYEKSQRLIKGLSKFPEIKKSSVPENSLLREFLGK